MNIGAVTFPWSTPAQNKREVSAYLRQHPQLYKAVLLVNQVVRATMTYTMMAAMPYSMAGKLAVGLGLSTFYWLTVEVPNCTLRFSLPAFAGAVAYEFSKDSLPALVNGAAFRSLQSFVSVISGTWPALLYAAAVMVIVDRDVQEMR